MHPIYFIIYRKLQLSPLIGGPSWLPLHVKVVINDKYGFDYVPLNPISSNTLKKLLTLQNVPAKARVLPHIIIAPNDENNIVENQYTSSSSTVDNRTMKKYVERAEEFCRQYTKPLNLITNNCWLFAFEMVDYVLQEEVS